AENVSAVEVSSLNRVLLGPTREMLGRSYGRSWGACGAGYLTLIRFKPALSATIAIGNPKSCDRTTYPDDWIKLYVGLHGSGASRTPCCGSGRARQRCYEPCRDHAPRIAAARDCAPGHWSIPRWPPALCRSPWPARCPCARASLQSRARRPAAVRADRASCPAASAPARRPSRRLPPTP